MHAAQVASCFRRFSTPHLLGRQLPAVWLAGVVVTLVTGSRVAIRLALAGA